MATGENDLATSGGERIQRPPRFADLYGIYRAQLATDSKKESLFDYGPGETTATFSDLDYPAGTAGIAQLSARDRQAGDRHLHDGRRLQI